MHIFSDIYEYVTTENKWKYIKCQVPSHAMDTD